jgi:hypothetical protein
VICILYGIVVWQKHAIIDLVLLGIFLFLDCPWLLGNSITGINFPVGGVFTFVFLGAVADW